MTDPAPATAEEWLALGLARRWALGPLCATHNAPMLTVEEAERAAELGADPFDVCAAVVRLPSPYEADPALATLDQLAALELDAWHEQ